MSNQRATRVFHHIDEKVAQLSPIPSERCIFRVHDLLRKINEKAYEPKVLSIGPYHHHKYNQNAALQAMEEHKLRYLQQLLKRRNETSVERYVIAMEELVERALLCYAEPVSLHKDEFIEMMLLDSCFIVELVRKNSMPELSDEDDPIFQLVHIRHRLSFDLMFFENQLPFFVLVQLFNMTKISDSRDNIIDMILNFLDITAASGQLSLAPNGFQTGHINHILDLVHKCSCLPFAVMLSQRNAISIDSSMTMKSVTELQEAGIKFKKAEERTLLDIRFVNGRIEIPAVRFDDATESVLRNLIAYEQYLPDIYPKYFTEYINFLDCLVNTSKDVEILRLQGIIHNNIGDDEVVSAILNKLGLEVCTDYYVCYSDVVNNVNKHCERKCNIWMASLRRNYLDSPWALISFLAGGLLLLFTVIQTVFSVLSFTDSHKSI